MSVPSKRELMKKIRDAGNRPDAAGFSKALNELRSRGPLSEKRINKIEGWIESEFPSSIKYLARELLKGESEDEEEKEREEKIPSWDARNICSSSTQNDLYGDSMPHDLHKVVSFLLPKGKQSECLTESDLRALLRPKDDWDQIYLFDPNKPATERAIVFAPVHRLPSSGIWIIGSAPYLRMLKAYQLESFGKHPIGAKVHTRSGIYGEVNELFLAKPLHYDDFKALIVNNTPLPSASTTCMCIFKPRMEDWSETFRSNYPIKDCEWLVPTWNGLPVALGKDCGQLLHWNYASITPPAATEISVSPEPEAEERENTGATRDAIEAANNANSIINAYWDIVNKKMTLIGENGEQISRITTFPIKAVLRVKDMSIVSASPIMFHLKDLDTESKRTAAKDRLATFVEYADGIDLWLGIKWPTVLPQSSRGIKSKSNLFNPDAKFEVDLGHNLAMINHPFVGDLED
jgi:hypothetical protein